MWIKKEIVYAKRAIFYLLLVNKMANFAKNVKNSAKIVKMNTLVKSVF